MNLTIIAAASENNVIGMKGKIPWDIPKDKKRFRGLTKDHPVIMGRKTYESILESLGKPLPQRKNIILSNTLASEEGIYIAGNIEEALRLTDDRDSYVIGGGEIYELFLPFTDRIELTRIHRHFEGDAFFPEVKWNDWNLVYEEKNLSESGIPYSFLTYEKITNQ